MNGLGTHGDGCEDLDEMLGKGVVQTQTLQELLSLIFSGCFQGTRLGQLEIKRTNHRKILRPL